jgi:pimeloyl-ACP methyl ester carboxylesterase
MTVPKNPRVRPPASLVVLACVPLLAAACATPVGVSRVDARTVHHSLTSNVLATGKLSGPSRVVLQRLDLYQEYWAAPETALAKLHGVAVTGGGSDVISALAEASFLHAEDEGKRSHYRAAAVYAYAFLFPEREEDAPNPLDPRLRLAADLYNRGITSGFASEDGSEVLLRSGTFELPFGELELSFDPSSLRWEDRELRRFVPVAELKIRGLRNRYRQPGVGAPLAADAALANPEERVARFIPAGLKVPASAFLRIEQPRRQLAERRLRASLELYVAFDAQSVVIGERAVPLEIEFTSYLAYTLAESPVWERELKGFLLGDLTTQETRLVALNPKRRGRTPLVLVHGTASSPGRWAELLNDLAIDPRIREHYQFWFFSYDTGNPIAYSAALLRESLREAVALFDPDGDDPALHKMVVIGHSQGGLLTKMMVIDTGNRLWDSVSRVPFEELDVSDESRELLRRSLFIEPLPFVRRVVFIATPHRGSFVAGKRISHWVARFVKMPSRVAKVGADIVTRNPEAMAFRSVNRAPSSVDNMTPGNPFVKGLASIPVAPGVSAHSIIPVKGDGPVEKGDDGVVEYSSAHIEGVESELVVRSSHSVQGHPDAIEEVRRILLLNAGVD